MACSFPVGICSTLARVGGIAAPQVGGIKARSLPQMLDFCLPSFFGAIWQHCQVFPQERLRSASRSLCTYFPTFTFDKLFMGGCSVVGGLLALLLPETLGSLLVESVTDVDCMGKEEGGQALLQLVGEG